MTQIRKVYVIQISDIFGVQIIFFDHQRVRTWPLKHGQKSEFQMLKLPNLALKSSDLNYVLNANKKFRFQVQ